MNEREKEKHTPGPWTLSYERPDERDCDLSEVQAPCYDHPNCHKTIVFVRGPERPPQCSYGENTEANARLIAAAPDLYAVLRDLEWIGMNDGRGVTHQQCPACSALKARGSGHNPFCGLAAALAKAEGEARHGG